MTEPGESRGLRRAGSEPAVPPGLRESAGYIHALGKPAVADVLRQAHDRGRVAVQPRCGVGGHNQMKALLRTFEAEAQPDILTLTIDSHTRLKRFQQAQRTLRSRPQDLNGYPLVTHGWRRGRELNESVAVPIEVRHGSPDPVILFDTSVASGLTSFEGGGISYNLPYAKDVPLAESLAAWSIVDRRCGELAELGVIVERELFGTLTAVLVPPSISLAISVLEAVLAARQGVRCISVAYPQGGHMAQDVAALRAVPLLARRYLPADVEVFPVLHEFMGVFPAQRRNAEDLIFYGALVARLGGAAKIITKTYQEAAGIPDTRANIDGMLLAGRANSPLFGLLSIDETMVAKERDWILAEVAEIVDPVLSVGPDTQEAVVDAFHNGTLDIPFSASRQARSQVIPKRDSSGAVRYLCAGGLPLSPATLRRHQDLLGDVDATAGGLLADLTADICYFPHLFQELPAAGAVRGRRAEAA